MSSSTQRFRYFKRWRELHGCRFVTLLCNDLYRGVQIGRLWIGWTNPYFKRHGW